MGFRFQRRINLGQGFGLNLSKSGIGASTRGKYGSVGTSGFSIRSGIPGLTFRQGWGRRGQGALVGLLVVVTIGAAIIAARVAIFLAALLWEAGRWAVLTGRDYLDYRRACVAPESTAQLNPPAGPGVVAPGDRTLAEIIKGSKTKAD